MAEDYFQPLEKALQEEPSLLQLVQEALPQLVQAAMQLGQLKPPEGLSYSLQQQSEPNRKHKLNK